MEWKKEGQLIKFQLCFFIRGMYNLIVCILLYSLHFLVGEVYVHIWLVSVLWTTCDTCGRRRKWKIFICQGAKLIIVHCAIITFPHCSTLFRPSIQSLVCPCLPPSLHRSFNHLLFHVYLNSENDRQAAAKSPTYRRQFSFLTICTLSVHFQKLRKVNWRVPERPYYPIAPYLWWSWLGTCWRMASFMTLVGTISTHSVVSSCLSPLLPVVCINFLLNYWGNSVLCLSFPSHQIAFVK